MQEVVAAEWEARTRSQRPDFNIPQRRGFFLGILGAGALPLLIALSLAISPQNVMNNRTWLTVGAALLVFGLAAALYYGWLERKWILPLRNLSRLTQGFLDSPEQPINARAGHFGALQGMSVSIRLLAERLRESHVQNQTMQRLREQSDGLEKVMVRVMSGDYSARVEVQPGPGESLAFCVNRLLDLVSERLEGARQASVHLKTSSERLSKLTARLVEAKPAVEPVGVQKTAAYLGDLLGVQIDSLMQSVTDLCQVMLRDGPRPVEGEESERLQTSFEMAGAQLTLLASRLQETVSTLKHFKGVYQETQILSTNLAIAAEARSFTQMEKLSDDARALAQSLAQMITPLETDLSQVIHGVEEVSDQVKEATGHYRRWANQLPMWERMWQGLQDQRNHVIRQMTSLRPAAKMLGKEIQSMAAVVSNQASAWSVQRASIGNLGDGATALGKAAEQVYSLLQQSQTARTIPSLPPPLAQSQTALERAIRDLTDQASLQGIEALTAESNAILDKVHKTSAEAQQRIQAHRVATVPRPAAAPPKQERPS